MDNIKIVVWDIETSLMNVDVFHMQRKYRNFIHYGAINQHTHLICACWKEVGKSKVHSVSLLDDKARFEKNPKDDYYVVKRISEVLTDADIIVAHNGDKFDTKTLKQRLMYHNLPPIPKIVSVDTLKVAKKEGEFPSNSLNALADYFNLGVKIDTNFELWQRCAQNQKKAIKEMTKYCKHDVALNEKVYLRMRPHMTNHPNIADVMTHNCPKCNSVNVHKHKLRVMASGIRKQQFHCQDCGGYFTSRYSESTKPLSIK